MKLLITESKLQKLQYSYLDSLDQISFTDPYIIIWGDDSEEYEINTTLIEYDYSDGRLFIDIDFLKKFESHFVYGDANGCEIITKWFENKFDVEVKYCDT